MVLSYDRYKTREDLIKDIKKEVLINFKESDYKEDDKINVSIHRVTDNFVSYISINDLSLYLNFFNDDDIKTLDSGLIPNIIEVGKDKYNRCLLFCLIEQDLWNDDEINKLQF